MKLYEKWKNAVFVGDSLVEGVTTDYRRTDRTWCKIVSDRFGFNSENYGRGGSCFTEGCNPEVSTLREITESVELDKYDVIFVSCGINDWYFAASKDQLRRAVEEYFKYLNTNFNGDVVFITPIFPAMRQRIRKPGIMTYEKLIYQKVSSCGVTLIIRGKEFTWKRKSTSSKVILWDGIHPTEYGYELYAENIINYLESSFINDK